MIPNKKLISLGLDKLKDIVEPSVLPIKRHLCLVLNLCEWQKIQIKVFAVKSLHPTSTTLQRNQ